MLACTTAAPPTATTQPTVTAVPSAATTPTPAPIPAPTPAPTAAATSAPIPSATPNPTVAELFGAVGSAGCTNPAAAAGDSSVQVEVDGTPRTALLHVPEWLADGQSVPLVLVLHGTFMSGEDIAGLSGYSRLADDAGFLVVYPDPSDDFPGWNASESSDLVNDVDFLRLLLDQLEATYCVDTERIFAAGFSAGGTMAHTTACRDERIEAISMVSSGFAVEEPICAPEDGVPTVAIQGVLDPLIPWFGGRTPLPELSDLPAFRALPDWTADIALQNGCDADAGALELAQIGDWVVPFEWQDCTAATILYRVGDGGHTWPGGIGLEVFGNINQDISASQLSYDFFLAHANPQLEGRVYENETAGYQVTVPEGWTGGVWVDSYGYHTDLAGSVTFPVGKPTYLLYATQMVLSSGPIGEGPPTRTGNLPGWSADELAESLIKDVPGYVRTGYTLGADGETVVVVAGPGLPMAGLFTHGDRAFLVFVYRELPLGDDDRGDMTFFLNRFDFTG
jgi:polyhydroxybutyrate depolymerase